MKGESVEGSVKVKRERGVQTDADSVVSKNTVDKERTEAKYWRRERERRINGAAFEVSGPSSYSPPSVILIIQSQETVRASVLSVEQLAEIQAVRASIIHETQRTATELGDAPETISTDTPPTILEWNGTRYVVRPACVDQLSYHMYFALQIALDLHRRQKVGFNTRHFSFMVALSSVIRCGNVKDTCNLECKTYGV